MVKLYLRGSLWFVAAQCFLLAAAHAQCTRNCGINPDSFRLLYQFTGSPDGAAPVVELLKDAAGNFYGTTSAGGNPTTCPSEGGCGTVFKLDSAGNETVLYEFTGAPDGATPQSPLVQDTAGNLYGTTSSGGASTFGTVFKIDTAGKETMLYSFGGPPDGEFPAGRLVLDAAGNLYGSTQNGGVSGDGTVFRLDTTGKETVLYSFTDRRPQGLIQDSAGILYGATTFGGLVNCTAGGRTLGCGTVFKVDTTGKQTVLYKFQGTEQGPDGGWPWGNLVLDSSGNLYGTTAAGGVSGHGTVFKLDTTGKETVLYNFSGVLGTDGGTDPTTGLVQDASGNLYGATVSSLFRLDPSGNLTLLYDFTGGADGTFPRGALIRDGTGNLYGVASQGGDLTCVWFLSTGCGTLFELPATTTPTFNVSVRLSGKGTVTSNPAGINCDATCWSGFMSGTSVTLTATAAPGYTFAGWGGLCSGTGACIAKSTESLIATFSLTPNPDFTLLASGLTPSTVNPGSSSTSAVTITSVGGFNGSVALSCAVQPSPALAPTCSITPNSTNPGTPAQLTVTTTMPMSGVVSSTFNRRSLYAAWMPLLGMIGAGTCFGSTRRKNWKISFVVLVFLLLAGLAFQAACGGSSGGGGGSGGTPPGSYTITVVGISGSIQHSTSAAFTVR